MCALPPARAIGAATRVTFHLRDECEMSDDTWVLLTRLHSNFDAERLVQDLTAAGIPAIMKSDAAGMFGPGFMGTMPHPILVYVPASALEEAQDFLE